MTSLSVEPDDRLRDPGAGPIRVIMEMHHCLQAYAGIAQETRLLFAELARSPAIALGGLLNTKSDLWAVRRRGSRDAGDALAQVRLVGEIDQMTARQKKKRTLWKAVLSRYRRSELTWIGRLARNRLGRDALVPIDSSRYGDFLWDKLFSPTLDATHRRRVLDAAYVAVRTGRRSAGTAAGWRAWSAGIDTAGWDVLIAQTPFPYRVDARTRLIVRFHDAISVFYPHTRPDSEAEARRDLRVLQENVRRGAFFACDSEPVRQDLLHLAPRAEDRATVIPVMVSPQFWPDRTEHGHVEDIVRTRTCPSMALLAKEVRKSGSDAAASSDACVYPPLSRRYFVAVSTLEPRKNYQVLIDAWGELRRHRPETPDLVLVANPGWRFAEAATAIGRWRGRGLLHLWRVSIDELRLLYSSAQAVVCPSIAEGFDLSGIEAMLCDTPVVASDIPVHRWVYGDAALYFDPFDAGDLRRLLERVGGHSKNEGTLASLRALGSQRGALYRPEVVVSKWQAFLEDVHSRSGAGVGGEFGTRD